jgi:hypothetical protein
MQQPQNYGFHKQFKIHQASRQTCSLENFKFRRQVNSCPMNIRHIDLKLTTARSQTSALVKRVADPRIRGNDYDVTLD